MAGQMAKMKPADNTEAVLMICLQEVCYEGPPGGKA